MKKSLLIVVALSITMALAAQEKVKQKEVGLIFSSLDNFGLTFKTGNQKAMWRFHTLFVSGNSLKEESDDNSNQTTSSGFGVKFGREYRKVLADRLEFRYGADLSFTYGYSKTSYTDITLSSNDMLRETTTYKPGVNLVIGFNYRLSDHIVAGAELMPYVAYTTGTSNEKNYYPYNDQEVKSDISGFSYGLSNNAVLLSLVYRF